MLRLFQKLSPKHAAFLLFLVTFIVYRASNPEPRQWYNHYVHLANSILAGHVDLPTLPSYYHDVVKHEGKTFIPFPPMPAIVLLPAVAIFGLATSQPLVSMIFGALNTALMFLLLNQFGVRRSVSVFLALFLAFGTVHWYAAVTGTVWYFAHIMAVFFLLLALLFLGKNKPFFSGLSLGAAALSRHPTILALFFFLKFLKAKKAWVFMVGLLILVGVQIFYNWARFGSFFETGYGVAYEYHLSLGEIYSFYRRFVPEDFPHFGLFDLRNIPLHLFTLLLMPPEILSSFPFLRPSPYGMSILLTSPLLLFVLRAPLKDRLVRHLWLAIFLVALPNLLHFTQGWVQFSYRFALDFMPFLILLLAIAIRKISKIHLFLFFWSTLVNYWGVWWGIKLGW